jgi:hypothetical protein
LHEYRRFFVKHSLGQYVHGAIHTNTIEGFWSIFKRGVVGTFGNYPVDVPRLMM